jgi:hypothetical protein
MKLSTAVKSAALAFLALALLDLPDEFDKFLRFVVLGGAIFAILDIQRSELSQNWITGITLAFSALAIIFNPILPLEMEIGGWRYFDALGALMFAGILGYEKACRAWDVVEADEVEGEQRAQNGVEFRGCPTRGRSPPSSSTAVSTRERKDFTLGKVRIAARRLCRSAIRALCLHPYLHPRGRKRNSPQVERNEHEANQYCRSDPWTVRGHHHQRKSRTSPNSRAISSAKRVARHPQKQGSPEGNSS